MTSGGKEKIIEWYKMSKFKKISNLQKNCTLIEERRKFHLFIRSQLSTNPPKSNEKTSKTSIFGSDFYQILYPVKNYTRPIQCNYFVVDFTANL